jgi:streptomycin 6-kinase
MDERVLHGDIHHENIRRHPIRGWLAIDPKGLYGERTFDAANLLLNPAGMEAVTESEHRLLRTAGILADKMSLPVARLLSFIYVYAALSASWSVEDGDDPRHALAIASLAERHVEL